MIKMFSKIKEEKKYYYLILIIISLIAAIPLIKFQVKESDDGYVHILRIIGVNNILKIGEFPPFIEPNYCSGWGYAINLFYPPLVTYGPLLFKCVTTHFYDALKIYTLCTIIVSAIAMYKCVEEITGKKEIALLAGVIYTLFPYKLETIYDRFAIGEFSAYMFIPLVFLGLYNLMQKDGKKHYWIAIGAIGLMLSHTITTEYTALFCLLYVIFNYKRLKNKEIVKKIIINILIILGITAFFTVPMIEHKLATEYTIFDSDIMLCNGKYVQAQTIEIWELFVDRKEDYVSFRIGLPIIVLSLFSYLAYKKVENKKDYIIFLFFAIISLIMCLNIFMWILLPDFLCTLQYPWRMLTFFGFFMSIVCAINAYMVIENVKNKNTAVLVAILFITILNAPMITRYKIPQENLNIDKTYEGKVESNLKINHFSINREYLPRKASKEQTTYLLTRTDEVYVLDGKCKIANMNKENLILDFEIENAQENSILELPYLYYLGYTAKIESKDGKEYKIETFESDNGFVAIKIPEDIEKGKVHVKYEGTAIEKISYVVSGLSTIATIIYVIISIRKGEKIDKECKS